MCEQLYIQYISIATMADSEHWTYSEVLCYREKAMSDSSREDKATKL